MGLRTASRTALCLACLLLTAAEAHAQLKDDAGVTTISDYPALATNVQPEHTAVIRAFARNVVITAATSTTVIIEVVGHADFDARGRAFETTVSQNRADSAAALLLFHIQTEIAQAQLPSSLRDRIHIVKQGVGTRFPVFPRPKNEQERRSNRRVELVHAINP